MFPGFTGICVHCKSKPLWWSTRGPCASFYSLHLSDLWESLVFLLAYSAPGLLEASWGLQASCLFCSGLLAILSWRGGTLLPQNLCMYLECPSPFTQISKCMPHPLYSFSSPQRSPSLTALLIFLPHSLFFFCLFFTIALVIISRTLFFLLCWFSPFLTRL